MPVQFKKAVPRSGVNGGQVFWVIQVQWFSPLTGVWFNGLQWVLALVSGFCVSRAGLGLAFLGGRLGGPQSGVRLQWFYQIIVWGVASNHVPLNKQHQRKKLRAANFGSLRSLYQNWLCSAFPLCKTLSGGFCFPRKVRAASFKRLGKSRSR